MRCVSCMARRELDPQNPTACDVVKYAFVFVLVARHVFDIGGLYISELHLGGVYDSVMCKHQNKLMSFCVLAPNQVKRRDEATKTCCAKKTLPTRGMGLSVHGSVPSPVMIKFDGVLNEAPYIVAALNFQQFRCEGLGLRVLCHFGVL